MHALLRQLFHRFEPDSSVCSGLQRYPAFIFFSHQLSLSNKSNCSAVLSRQQQFSSNIILGNGQDWRFLASDKNSSRVSLLWRNAPSIALVTACPCCFSTPRICMHKCRASTITPTPSGLIFSSMAWAIWLVKRSWICNLRANIFTRRATLLKPMTFLFGKYATWHFPKNGSK